PSAPTGLVASPGSGSGSLSWNASSGAMSYNIYPGTTSGGGGTTPVAPTASTSYSDAGLTNGTTYYYKVSAANSAGTSAQSGEVSATPSATSQFLDINSGGAA